ncbi:hypothetical protein ACQ9LF_06270 [Anaerohalosphaeraceae bacterium U12dextr]
MDIKTVLKHLKYGVLVPPQLKDNGNLTGNTYFDTAGMAAVLVLGIVGTTDIAIGSTNVATPPYLEECDTTNGTYTKIPGSDLSAVISATDDNKIVGWFVDRAATRKRYLEINSPLAGDGTTGANFAAIAIGIPEGNLPITAAACGLKELISV